MINDADLQRISQTEGTPYYLINGDTISKVHDRFRKAFSLFRGEIRVAYAVKANSNVKVLERFGELHTYFDILTPGEIDLLCTAGLPPERMIYTSVSETYDEFSFAIRKGVRRFVVGSCSGIDELSRASAESGVTPSVSLRLNPGIDVNAQIATAGRFSKFGVPIFTGQRSVKKLVQELIRNKSFDFEGLHFHLGTQVKDPTIYARAINRVLEFAKKHGIRVTGLDIGGGFPVRYVDPVPPIEKFGRVISSTLNDWINRIGDFNLTVESGRYLVAESGTLVTSVTNIKEFDAEAIVITDANYNQVPDLLIGQHYRIRSISAGKGRRRYRIAGNLCDGNDWLERRPTVLPSLSKGDLLVLESVGAYSDVFQMDFCRFGIPPIIFVRGNERVVDRPRRGAAKCP